MEYKRKRQERRQLQAAGRAGAGPDSMADAREIGFMQPAATILSRKHCAIRRTSALPAADNQLAGHALWHAGCSEVIS